MKITACPLCGSKNIDIADMRDGSSPNIEWEKKVCRKCGWTGIPLEFDSEKDYQLFRDDLQKEDNIQDINDYMDPAASAPIRRYLIRGFWTYFILLLILIIPGVVFVLISVWAGFVYEVGVLSALLSFFCLIYVVWKNELWNKIQR